MRPTRIIIAILLLKSLTISAQVTDLLEKRINIKTGAYSSTGLLKLLEDADINISYSNSALVKKEIRITVTSISVREIIEKAFDLDNYNYKVAGNKILISPKKNNGLRTYSGFIEDQGSGERLVGVNIYMPALKIGSVTNAFGYFSLSVPSADTLLLTMSAMGYESKLVRLYPGQTTELDLSMRAVSTQLAEVTVLDETMLSELVQMSELSINPGMLKDFPTLFGEEDVFRTLQLMPGVQSGNEGSAGLYVRGGSPDQNLILLDGVPVYNASHLFGVFSIFNSDAIKNVTLTKGGFPARYGGRLSSIISIDMKEGNMKEFHGDGAIGLISSKLTLEGPLVKDKTSFMLSGRRTYLDLLIRPFQDEGVRTGYYFGDVNFKINHIFNRQNRLYLSLYGGRDKFYYQTNSLANSTSDYFIKWGNLTSALRYNHIFNSKLFSNLTATYSQYLFSTGQKFSVANLARSSENTSLVRDYGLRYDLEYQPYLRHKFRAGFSYTHHHFKPGLASIIGDNTGGDNNSELNTAQPIYSHDAFLYGEDEWTVNDELKINYGFHYSQYLVQGKFYNYIQPRVSARYMLSPGWSVKASYVEMAQYIHLLSNSGVGLPTDLWVSSTKKVSPQYSRQIAWGSTREWGDNKWEISLEFYYKWMRNLITYRDGSNFLTTTAWENTIETNGTGKSYGTEFLLRKNSGKLTGWLGYTLARSTRQFSAINDGKEFPFRYDRRHDLSIALSYKFSKRFDMGLNWTYGTGIAFTAPIAEFSLASPGGGGIQTFVQYTDRNSQRLPAYHRLDLGFNFHKDTKWGKRTWNVSLYNAYSRANPFFIYVERNADRQMEAWEVSLLPIIPSVSYIFSF